MLGACGAVSGHGITASIARVLESSLNALMSRLNDSHQVLDVGGWIKPLTRADYVIDVMPYNTRAQHGCDGIGKERFTEQTWVQRDICAREPWPFADKQFDYAVCSHTLEDVRDPIWVCSELNRVAKGGYIEVPSRLDEQTMGVQGGPWVGWGHHHWFIDIVDGQIDFVFKTHVVNRDGNYFPPDFIECLTPEDRVNRLWWEEAFTCEERLLFEPGEVDSYLSQFVERESQRLHYSPREGPGFFRRAATRLRRMADTG